MTSCTVWVLAHEGGRVETCDTVNECYIYFYVIGQRGLGFRRLALRLEALSTQVQRLSRERDVTQLTREDVSLLLQRLSIHRYHPSISQKLDLKIYIWK